MYKTISLVNVSSGITVETKERLGRGELWYLGQRRPDGRVLFMRPEEYRLLSEAKKKELRMQVYKPADQPFDHIQLVLPLVGYGRNGYFRDNTGKHYFVEHDHLLARPRLYHGHVPDCYAVPDVCCRGLLRNGDGIELERFSQEVKDAIEAAIVVRPFIMEDSVRGKSRRRYDD